MKTLKLFIRVLLIPVWIIIFFIYLFIWYIQMSWYYFDNYKKEYPGEYIGLSEEEYNIFTELSCYDGNDAIKVEICDCLRSETEYSFLVFQGVEIYYYNKNNTKYKVEWN